MQSSGPHTEILMLYPCPVVVLFLFFSFSSLNPFGEQGPFRVEPGSFAFLGCGSLFAAVVHSVVRLPR